MNILVVGPQHSTTRYVLSLLNQIDEVKRVDHCSVPSDGDKYYEFSNWVDEFDKYIIVSRDMSAINSANYLKHNIDINENISLKINNFILNEVKKIKSHEKYNKQFINFFSYETLLSYREEYLEFFLSSLGLSTDKLVNIEEDNYVTTKEKWFTTNLKLEDCNKKYNKFYGDK